MRKWTAALLIIICRYFNGKRELQPQKVMPDLIVRYILLLLNIKNSIRVK